jgi:hypothetical protein
MEVHRYFFSMPERSIERQQLDFLLDWLTSLTPTTTPTENHAQ